MTRSRPRSPIERMVDEACGHVPGAEPVKAPAHPEVTEEQVQAYSAVVDAAVRWRKGVRRRAQDQVRLADLKQLEDATDVLIKQGW